MSKILAVFGATGQQGSSVISHVLQDPELSAIYTIRAVTRDPGSSKAKQLAEKVEVVEGDVFQPASLKSALVGVNTVFAMTNPDFGPGGVETEFTSGKNIADAAVANGAEYIVFSTLPDARAISGGKYTKCSHFDAKAQIEKYIRGLNVKSAYISPGFFMGNFNYMPFQTPKKTADGTYVFARHNSPETRWPMYDAQGDTGKYVGAILAEPDKFEGKTFCASSAMYSSKEVAEIMSKVTGKTVVYKQIPFEEFKAGVPFGAGEIIGESFSYPEEFGYYGPQTEELVAWAAENARGKVTTYEEFLRANPLPLEE